MSLTASSRSALLGLAIALGGCAGPPVLERQVIGYDEVTSRLDQKLLLLNIARVDNGRPVHFTSTSSIAATFDWTTTLGAGGQINRVSSANFLDLNIGTSASENPTFSIVPLSGEAFTQRILTAFQDKTFEFLVFQGGAIDRVMRLLAAGIEVQDDSGRFARFIENNPQQPREYEEFRRIAMHLRSLNDSRRLFVRSLVFDETIVANFKGPVSPEDFNNAYKAGLEWRQQPDGTFNLTRLVAGRVVVTNYDPMSLSDEKRFELNDKIRKNPRGFVYVDIQPGSPGGDLPVHGAIKLRSMLQMLVFVANGLRDAPEFDVAPDARTGRITENPRTTLGIDVSPTAPTRAIASVEFAGTYYSVANTRWDRATFAMLGDLFQTAVGEVKDVSVPITIAK